VWSSSAAVVDAFSLGGRGCHGDRPVPAD